MRRYALEVGGTGGVRMFYLIVLLGEYGRRVVTVGTVEFHPQRDLWEVSVSQDLDPETGSDWAIVARFAKLEDALARLWAERVNAGKSVA